MKIFSHFPQKELENSYLSILYKKFQIFTNWMKIAGIMAGKKDTVISWTDEEKN